MTKPKIPIVSKKYTEILLKEGNKMQKLFLFFNENLKFKTLLKKIKSDNFKDVAYKAEHIFLYDLITIFKTYSSIEDNKSLKSDFLLLYFYELIQGKNLLKKYNLEKIDELINSKGFQKNVELILETNFFKPKTKFAKELIFPLLIKNLEREQKNNYVTFFKKICSVLIDTEEKLSNNEKLFLEEIYNKIENPKIILDTAKINEIAEDDSLEKVMAELNELIGLKDIKKNVEDISNFLKVQKLRADKNLKTSLNSLHAVFMGPPGTGKTTVARLLGRIYKHLGFLEKGHLIETDRAGLVAGYVGQTAIKTEEIINSALGGVLFIDEAYSLSSKGINDFGNEAIEILLKRMEDHRKELVVVVAGYPDEMENFIQSNPGLKSRFSRYFEFKDFNAQELLDIFKIICKKNDFKLASDAEEKLLDILERVCEKEYKNFGNARSVRNLFEKIIENQANRIVILTEINEEILRSLNEEDIPPILKTVEELLQFNEK